MGAVLALLNLIAKFHWCLLWWLVPARKVFGLRYSHTVKENNPMRSQPRCLFLLSTNIDFNATTMKQTAIFPCCLPGLAIVNDRYPDSLPLAYGLHTLRKLSFVKQIVFVNPLIPIKQKITTYLSLLCKLMDIGFVNSLAKTDVHLETMFSRTIAKHGIINYEHCHPMDRHWKWTGLSLIRSDKTQLCEISSFHLGK